jgi:secreted Zn-dependent insulinase-like peptidase
VLAELPEKLMEKAKSMKFDKSRCPFKLPEKNIMIPKNFQILEADEKYSNKPILLQQWIETDLWYKKDDKYQRPKAIVEMKIYTNDNGFGQNIKGRLFAHLWQRIVSEYLREFIYTSEMANVEFALVIQHNNFNFTFKGYNDTLGLFIS